MNLIKNKKLAVRKILVTGAGSNGIGRAVAKRLASEGVDTFVHYFDQVESARKLVHWMQKKGIKAYSESADISNPISARNLVKSAARQLGGLDGVVHCAAALERKSFLEITDDDWDRIHAINLRGSFVIGQESAKIMLKGNKKGRIVFISSINQERATPLLAHYVSSKGGLRMLARAMALELASVGITVNLIAPGTVETDLNRLDLKDKKFRNKKQSLIPLKKIAKPSNITDAIVFLLGKKASYLTGSTITIDGGLTL